MSDREQKYLGDIILAISLVEEFCATTPDFEKYSADLKTKSAVERQLGIIGEAINHLRRENPDFELSHARKIIDFRNRLVHSYDSIDDSIVWAIIRIHLPQLKSEAAALLNP